MQQSSFEIIIMQEDPTLYGKPVCVLEFKDQESGDRIKFDKEALENILLHEEVKDRKIMAMSIVGAFRKGKSFMMDYFLRYLYAHVSTIIVF